MSRAAPQFCSLSAANLRQFRFDVSHGRSFGPASRTLTPYFHNRSACDELAGAASIVRGPCAAPVVSRPPPGGARSRAAAGEVPDAPALPSFGRSRNPPPAEI